MQNVLEEELVIEDVSFKSIVHADQVSHSWLERVMTEHSQNAISGVASGIAASSKVLSCKVDDLELYFRRKILKPGSRRPRTPDILR